MARKKTVTRDAKKEVLPAKREGVLFSWISSNRIFLLLLLLAGILWFGFYETHTKEIPGSDDREYASIARNIINGKGIVRDFAYPVEVHFFEKLPIPEFVHPPGYPLILAGFLKLFGTREWAALLPSYLSYFILVGAFFFFARKSLGFEKATLSALMLIFNQDILDFSLVTLSEGVYTLVFFLFFILFVQASSLRVLWMAGFLLGLSHLIRENVYPFFLPLFVYLYFYPHLPRWKKWIWFMIGFLIPILANMVRNLLDAGSPFFSYGKFALMAFTEKYPWLNVYRSLENPSLIEFIFEAPGLFISKYVNNFVQTLQGFLSISNPYVLAFFLMEMFYWKIDPEWKRRKMLFLSLLVFQVLFIPLFTFTQRFFIPFLPIVILFASQGFYRTVEALISGVKADHKRKALFLVVLLFFFFFMLPTVYTIFQPHKAPALGFKTPQYGFLIPKKEAERLNEFLKNELRENQVIWTDLPEILEWEGNRSCGWLPTKIQMVYEIHRKFPVDAILLTSVRTPRQMEEEWRYLLFSEHSLPRYRTVKFYKEGMIFAKLLIRDEKD